MHSLEVQTKEYKFNHSRCPTLIYTTSVHIKPLCRTTHFLEQGNRQLYKLYLTIENITTMQQTVESMLEDKWIAV